MSATVVTETPVEETSSLPNGTNPKKSPRRPDKPVEQKTESSDEIAEPKLEREVVTESDRELDAEAPARPRKPEQQHKAEHKPSVSTALQKLKNATDIEAYQWINAIAGEGAIQVAVVRREPKTFTDPNTGEKKKTDGTVATYDRTITESEIQEAHGGGTYLLQVKTKNALGRWEYFGGKTVEIAGDPRLDDVPRNRALPVAQGTTIVAPPDPTAGKGMEMMMGILGDQLKHANRPQPPSGPSSVEIATLLAQATAPLQVQINALLQQLSEKDKALLEARQSPPDPFRDKMLNTLMDGESARITALRTQHESEIRTLKEGWKQTEDRIRDQAQRDLDRAERAHERELATIKSSHEIALKMADQSGTLSKTVLESENKRLEKQNDVLTAELKELRAKKDPSFKDKFDELKNLKELVNGDDGDDDTERSTLAQIVEVAGNLPAFNKLVERVAGPSEVQQAPAAAQPQRRQRLVRNAAGHVFERTPQGMVPLKPKNQEVAVEGGGKVEIPPIDPESLKTAISYMEGACRANTDPAVFAQGARPYVGPAILQAIRVLGVTEFLSKIGKIDGGSVLATQSGRNWSKKVASHLLASDEENNAAPVEPPPPQEG